MGKYLENEKLLEGFNKEYGHLFTEDKVSDAVHAAVGRKKAAKERALAIYKNSLEQIDKAYNAAKAKAVKSGKLVVKHSKNPKVRAGAAALGAAGGVYGTYRYAKSKSKREGFNKEYGHLFTEDKVSDAVHAAVGRKKAAKERALAIYKNSLKQIDKAYNAAKAKAVKSGKFVVKHSKNPKVAIPVSAATALTGYGAYRYAKTKRAKGVKESEIIATAINVLKEGYNDLCPSTDNPSKCQKVLEARIAKLQARLRG